MKHMKPGYPPLHKVFGMGCLTAVITITGSIAQDKELEAVRARHQAAVEAATAPLRAKYLADLEELKKRALEMKDLDAAVIIDEEIKLIKPVPRSGEIRTASDLAVYLNDTTWSWGKSEREAVSRLTFRKDGTCVINRDAPVPWSVVDEKTVKMGGNTVLKFNASHQRFSAETPLGKRAGKKL